MGAVLLQASDRGGEGVNMQVVFVQYSTGAERTRWEGVRCVKKEQYETISLDLCTGIDDTLYGADRRERTDKWAPKMQEQGTIKKTRSQRGALPLLFAVIQAKAIVLFAGLQFHFSPISVFVGGYRGPQVQSRNLRTSSCPPKVSSTDARPADPAIQPSDTVCVRVLALIISVPPCLNFC